MRSLSLKAGTLNFLECLPLTYSSQITIFIDNQASLPLQKEHGFSLLLTIKDKNILFDTGASDKFIQNAKLLNIDLTKISTLIISHGHYDHTGGLASLLKLCPNLSIFLHPNSLIPRYSFDPKTEKFKNIGISSKNKKILINEETKLIWNNSPHLILRGVGITGFIPRDFPVLTYDNFYEDLKKTRIDIIPDEQALWVNTKDKIIIITGCCHAGIANTINYILKLTKANKKEIILIGGFHLSHYTPADIQKLYLKLKEFNFKKIVACHCTGRNSFLELKKYFGDKIIFGYVGLEIEF